MRELLHDQVVEVHPVDVITAVGRHLCDAIYYVIVEVVTQFRV